MFQIQDLESSFGIDDNIVHISYGCLESWKVI